MADRGAPSSSAPPPRDSAASYAAVVLAGLAGAGLAAVAATRTWATASGDAAGLAVAGRVSGAETQPLAAALTLVALAGWGVVLVLRGRLRRVVAALALLAATGVLVTVVLGITGAPSDATRAATAAGSTDDVTSTSLTVWIFLCGVGALVTGAALAVAVARAPRWPAMGSRYDAPATRAGHGAPPPEPRTEEDLWKALDEGRDPT